MYIEVHCVVIEYENRKGKPTNFLVHIVQYDNPYDQRQEWFQNWREIVPDPALARALGFYNIYHQNWALIEQEKILMHCENTTFTYDNEFKEYMMVEGASQKISLIISLMLELENSCQKNETNIFMNYLKNGIQSISN